TVFSGTGEASRQNPVTEQTRLVLGLLALMVTDERPGGAPGRMTKAERSVAEGAVLAAYRAKGRPRGRPGDVGRHAGAGAGAGGARARGARRGRGHGPRPGRAPRPVLRRDAGRALLRKDDPPPGRRADQLRPGRAGRRAAPPGGLADRRPHLEAGQARPQAA